VQIVEFVSYYDGLIYCGNEAIFIVMVLDSQCVLVYVWKCLIRELCNYLVHMLM
jgi:hypothetical protein